MARQLTAQFTSRCVKCGNTITVGTTIFYEKSHGSWHAVCPTKSAPAPKFDAPSVEAAQFLVYEKWPPCRRAHLHSAVGETRRYERELPKSREAMLHAAEPGVYTVVAQDGYYQSADENEDMGDCSGPGWQMTLYLRYATPEEVDRDAADRMREIGPAFFRSLGEWSRRCEARRVREAFDAETVGLVRTGAWSWDAIKAAGLYDEERDGERVARWPRDDRYSASAVRHTAPDGAVYYILDLSVRDWDYVLLVASETVAERIWDAMLAKEPISVEKAQKMLERTGRCFGDEIYEHVLRKAGASLGSAA